MTPVADGVAVVTVVHGRRPHLLAQHASLLAGDLLPEHRIVVSMGEADLVEWRPEGELRPDVRLLDLDPTHPDRLPLAAARNLGAAAALEAGASCLVFLDVDCLAGPGLVDGYAADVTRDPWTVWSGPVTYLPPAPAGGYPLSSEGLAGLDAPHPARPALSPGEHRPGADWSLFWSLSFAVSAPAWTETGGFCPDYRGYGGEDTDFAQLARSAGLGLGWTGTPRAYHQHHPVSSPPVEHADDIVRNAQLFHRRWGWWPMTGWLEELALTGHVRRTPDGWARR